MKMNKFMRSKLVQVFGISVFTFLMIVTSIHAETLTKTKDFQWLEDHQVYVGLVITLLTAILAVIGRGVILYDNNRRLQISVDVSKIVEDLLEARMNLLVKDWEKDKILFSQTLVQFDTNSKIILSHITEKVQVISDELKSLDVNGITDELNEILDHKSTGVLKKVKITSRKVDIIYDHLIETDESFKSKTKDTDGFY